MKIVYTGVDSGVAVPGIGVFIPGQPVELEGEIARRLLKSNPNFRRVAKGGKTSPSPRKPRGVEREGI